MTPVGRHATAEQVAAGLIVVGVLLTGPLGVVDVVDPGTPQLGDGTASITVLEPEREEIDVTDGRFGTNTSYVRLPDLVVDVRDLRGTPRVVYQITLPELGVDATARRVLTSGGRVRLDMEDRALSDRPASGVYTGSMTVRVQSFSGSETVLNRSVEVRVA